MRYFTESLNKIQTLRKAKHECRDPPENSIILWTMFACSFQEFRGHLEDKYRLVISVNAQGVGIMISAGDDESRWQMNQALAARNTSGRLPGCGESVTLPRGLLLKRIQNMLHINVASRRHLSYLESLHRQRKPYSLTLSLLRLVWPKRSCNLFLFLIKFRAAV